MIRLQRNKVVDLHKQKLKSSRLSRDEKMFAEDVLRAFSRHVLKTSLGRSKYQLIFAGLQGSLSIQIFLVIQKFIILRLFL